MLKNLVNLFFPPVCSGCHSFLMTNETVICTKCRHDLPQTNHHIHTENEAFKKFYGRIPVIHASAFLYFHKKIFSKLTFVKKRKAALLIIRK